MKALLDRATSLWYPCFAAYFLATLIVGLVHDKMHLLETFPWWIFVCTLVYSLLLCFENRWVSLFSSISKVYAPFVILVYWGAIYPHHHPWRNPTDTFLVVSAHIIAPCFAILELFWAKDMHYALYRQRNADFPVLYSFYFNTVVYIAYVVFYLSFLPGHRDPIYTSAGFSKDEGKDVLLLLVGWVLVMGSNSIMAVLTWYWKERETEASAHLFTTR